MGWAVCGDAAHCLSEYECVAAVAYVFCGDVAAAV